MRQTNKKTTTKKKVATKTKNKSLPEIAEKQYVNIKQYESEIVTKTSKLKIAAFVFSLFLLTFWIITVRYNIKNQSDNLNFSFLKEEINKSIDRFDTEIINRKKTEAIIINDIDEIKTKLDLKNKKLDSSLWPTRKLTELNLTIQYPDNWLKAETTSTNQIILINENKNSIIIDLIEEKGDDLNTWLEKSNLDFALYEKSTDIFKFSTDTPERIIYTKDLTNNQLEKIYLIKKSDIILKIKTVLDKNNEEESLIIEEIIKTIKIN